MFDLVDIFGWLLVALFVLMVVAEFRRWRNRRVDQSATRSVNYAITPKRHDPLRNFLSKRETQIAHMVVEGKRSAAIAEELDVSVHTVDSHIQRIYFKLEVHNRLELVHKIRDLTE